MPRVRGARNGTAPDPERSVWNGFPPVISVGSASPMGVSMELNHINQATRSLPPLPYRLFWSWNAGYKFPPAGGCSRTGLPQGFSSTWESTLCTPEGRAHAGGDAEMQERETG